MTHHEEIELATRAVWLSYIGGYNQSEIASRLGVSRIKVHRLIAQAHALGLVKVNIEHRLTSLVALEERLVGLFGLRSCTVVPAFEFDGPKKPRPDAMLTALGMAGAQFLRRQMSVGAGPRTIGLGWGRTWAAVADQTWRGADGGARHCFVALIGSLTRHSSANPYDVIHRLVDRTGSEGYYLPVPYIADTLADRAVLVAQQSVQNMLALARRADACLVGIGQCSEDSFLKGSDLITDVEFNELRAAGAVGDLIGKFFDRDGGLVDSEVNARSIGLSLDELGGRYAVGIAGGEDKTAAVRAALKSGALSGLITDETIARQLADSAEADVGAPGQRTNGGTAAVIVK